MNKGGRIVGGLVVGALVGTVLGILFAPRSGRETRDLIKKKAKTFKDRAVGIKNTAIKAGKEMTK